MIISRRNYEQDLKKAYEKGRLEAEARYYQERANERMCEQLDKLRNSVRKLECKQDPAAKVPMGCPFD